MSWFRRGDAALSVFHAFAPPPTGGGHQFMRALCQAFEADGLRLDYNRLARQTPACLFNSYNFDFQALERAFRRHGGVRRVHRIDGPLLSYRGFDDGTDARIAALNRRWAQATVCQSRFSLEQHQALGFGLADPVIIPNTPDPRIFHARGRASRDPGGKLRVISVSWSDNPNKGLDIYRRLDEILDPMHVDFTFVGRIRCAFKRIRLLPPLPSEPLADLLRQHDAYLTASRNDPCSNSLMEALACGLPALYLNSGGHPELAGAAGLPFEDADEVPALLGQFAADLPRFQSAIRIPSLPEIAARYRALLFPDRAP